MGERIVTVEKVYFYNHFGNGDIFESLEFVKEWMEILGDREYFYAHGKPAKIIWELEGVTSMNVTEEMQPMRAIHFNDETKSMFINTWIGRDGRYVLPGIGVVVERLWRMHNDMLSSIGCRPLSKPIIEYVPNLNYELYPDCINVEYWMRAEAKHRRLFLIDNGNVQSNQAKNFDFTPIIEEVAKQQYDDFFITTHSTGLGLPNIWETSEIIRSKDGFDLPEVSFLSRFSDGSIGRNSGPHVYTQVRDNWLDPDYKFLSFTYKQQAAYFVLNQPVVAKKWWSPYINDGQVIENMLEFVREV
jgi:hypothetical protein